LEIELIISALSLALDIFTTGRSLLRERKDGDLLPPSLLAATYERLQYLRKELRRLRMALSEEDPAGDRYRLPQLWENFLTSLRQFTYEVRRLNLSALSIYDREIAGQLAQAFDVDSAIYSDLLERAEYYEAKQGPKPPKRDLKKLHQLNNRFRVINQDLAVAEAESYLEVLDPDAEQTRADFASQLTTLEELLEKLSEQLATFIRVNWTPKDLS
jgi:hypothetical protein